MSYILQVANTRWAYGKFKQPSTFYPWHIANNYVTRRTGAEKKELHRGPELVLTKLKNKPRHLCKPWRASSPNCLQWLDRQCGRNFATSCKNLALPRIFHGRMPTKSHPQEQHGFSWHWSCHFYRRARAASSRWMRFSNGVLSSQVCTF